MLPYTFIQGLVFSCCEKGPYPLEEATVYRQLTL
jgi:hypothetical protein